MPVEHLLRPLLGEEIPLDGLPQGGDVGAQLALCRIGAVEVGARRQQPLEQQPGLHQIGTVVIGREGKRLPRLAVDPVREGAVIGGRPLRKEGHDPLHPLARLAAGHETALGSHRHGHHAEARPAGSDRRARRGALARHAARRFGTLPEIAEGLLLHLGEQLLVGNLREFVARVQPRPDPDHLAGQDRLPGSRFQAAVDDQPVGSIRVQPGGGFERDALRAVVNVAGVHLRASGVEQIDIGLDGRRVERRREVEHDLGVGRHVIEIRQAALPADRNRTQRQLIARGRAVVGRIAAAADTQQNQCRQERLEKRKTFHISSFF